MTRGLGQIREELARPFAERLEATKDKEKAALVALAAQQARARDFRLQLDDLAAQRRALAAPQVGLKAEISELERETRELQGKLEARRRVLAESEKQALGLDDQGRQLRGELRVCDAAAERCSTDLDQLKAKLAEAQEGIQDVAPRAIRAYLDEIFNVLLNCAAEPGARASYEAMRASFLAASRSEPALAAAAKEAEEIQRLLQSASAQALRGLLAARHAEIETELSARFPGLVSGPPPPEPDQMFETYFWFDQPEDTTKLLCPISRDCWDVPPDQPGDARGRVLCAIVWAMVGTLAEDLAMVPNADFVGDLGVLEFHGDVREKLERITEVSLPNGRSVAILSTELPRDLAEVLG